MGGGGGGAWGRAFRIQSVTDRGLNVVNDYKLFIQSLENCPAVPDIHNEATEPFCIPHARFPRQSDILV